MSEAEMEYSQNTRQVYSEYSVQSYHFGRIAIFIHRAIDGFFPRCFVAYIFPQYCLSYREKRVIINYRNSNWLDREVWKYWAVLFWR